MKSVFIWAVAVTMFLVFAASALTVYGCYRIQKVLLPDSQAVWLNTRTVIADGRILEGGQRAILDEPVEVNILVPTGVNVTLENTRFIIERIDSGFSTLRPKQQLLYRVTGISMVVLPFVYSIAGIMLCARWFYRRELWPPIQVLADATKHIREQDLDFMVDYNRNDELGRLCIAFEEMRQALYNNNRQLWNMIEQRRILQASVAHDLRNPIAIVEGYVEYMQQCLADGNLNEEELQHTLSNLAITAKRLEHYTDYIRDLNAIEETETKYSVVQLPDFLRSATESLLLLAEQHSLEIAYHSNISECQVKLDEQIFYRIVENIFSNAIRYARSKVSFRYSITDDMLIITISDDGKGFSKAMLRKKNTFLYSDDKTGEHMGLGLATSRVLSQKHGGSLELSNITPSGACVTIKIAVHIMS
ncbi:MAG: HAMP domain-containing histidine kinase [Lachnospiraceae bacterium]|nr:HAMP domain-containing histidine kinase [Lachnospiraceae bacterium]